MIYLHIYCNHHQLLIHDSTGNTFDKLCTLSRFVIIKNEMTLIFLDLNHTNVIVCKLSYLFDYCM